MPSQAKPFAPQDSLQGSDNGKLPSTSKEPEKERPQETTSNTSDLPAVEPVTPERPLKTQRVVTDDTVYDIVQMPGQEAADGQSPPTKRQKPEGATIASDAVKYQCHRTPTKQIEFAIISVVFTLAMEYARCIEENPLENIAAVLAVNFNDKPLMPLCIILLPIVSDLIKKLAPCDKIKISGVVNHRSKMKDTELIVLEFMSEGLEVALIEEVPTKTGGTIRVKDIPMQKRLDALKNRCDDISERYGLEPLTTKTVADAKLSSTKNAHDFSGIKAMICSNPSGENLFAYDMDVPHNSASVVSIPQYRAIDIAALTSGKLVHFAENNVPLPLNPVPVFIFNFALSTLKREATSCIGGIDKHIGMIFPIPNADTVGDRRSPKVSTHDNKTFVRVTEHSALPSRVDSRDQDTIWFHIVGVVIIETEYKSATVGENGKPISACHVVTCAFPSSIRDVFKIFIYANAAGNATKIRKDQKMNVFYCKARSYTSPTTMAFNTVAAVSHFSFPREGANPIPTTAPSANPIRRNLDELYDD